MRYLKILFTLPLLFCCGWGQMSVHTGALPWKASTGGGGITPVGTPVCGIGATPYTISYTANAGGDTIVVGANGLYGYLGTATVTDSKSDTFTQSAAPGYYYPGIYTNLSITSGVTSITITTTGGTGSIDACVSEYSGPKHVGNTNNNYLMSSGTSYSNSLTMQDAHNYIVGVFAITNNGTQPTPTATAGTIRAYNNGNSNGSIFLQDNTSTSAGSLAVSGSISSAYLLWGSAVELRSQ